jgi:tetratricopeptide (TPR) repeat protein
MISSRTPTWGHRTGWRAVFSALLFLGAVLGLASPGMAAAVASPIDTDPPAEIAQVYQAGHYDQAVEALEAAIGKSPEDAGLQYWLGRSYYEKSDYGKAISSFERATNLEPANSEFHRWLGIACGRKAEESNMFSAFNLARRTHHEFQTAVQLDPSNLEAQRDLIRFMMFAPGFLGGGDDHAMEQLAALALVDPVQADLAQAEYFTARKKFDQAGEQYQKLLDAGGQKAGVYFEIAEYYRDRGQPQEMRRALEAARRANPADQRLEYYRGVLLVLEKGDAARAEKYLRLYLNDVPPNSAFPSQASAHEWLGKLYEAESKPGLAEEEYRTAQSLNPRNKDFREEAKRLEKK